MQIKQGKLLSELVGQLELYILSLNSSTQVNSLPTLSGAHFKPKADKDRNLLLEEIDEREHVFRVKPAGQKHKTFPHVKPLLQHKPKVLMKWMNRYIKKMISLKT